MLILDSKQNRAPHCFIDLQGIPELKDPCDFLIVRGFTQFIALVDLQDPNKGYLVNDTLTIEAHVSVRPQENYYA